MSSGFRVTLLVDRRPLRTTEHHGTTYALAAPGRAFEVAISHSNNATYMVRLEVDGVDAEPVRAAGGAHSPHALEAAERAREPRVLCVLCGLRPACLLTAAAHGCGRTHAGLPQEGAARRDDAVHGLPVPARHPRVPVRRDARRRGRAAQQQRGGGAAARVRGGDGLRDAAGARGGLEP